MIDTRIRFRNLGCVAAVAAALGVAPGAFADQVVRNYDTNDLRQWGGVHCGGQGGSCPCPGGASGSCSPANTPSPLPPGGRFVIDHINQVQGGSALKITLCDGDAWVGGTWRNELVDARVYIDKGEKWFFWYTRLGDSTGTCATQNSCSSTAECFPPPPAGTNQLSNVFHVFTQWHHAGHNASPPLSLGVDVNSAGQYEIQFGSSQTDMDPNFSTDHINWHTPILRGAWHSFALHVNFAPDASGFFELWHATDGGPLVKQTNLTCFGDLMSNPNAPTLFNQDRCHQRTMYTPCDTAIDTGGCATPPTGPAYERVFMAQGLYRSNHFTVGKEVVWHDGTVQGTSANEIVPPECCTGVACNAPDACGLGAICGPANSSSCTGSDFTISATTPVTVQQGSTGTSTVQTSAIGSAQQVTLSASGQPAGVTTSFAVNPITSGGSTTMTISAAATVVPGPYTLTVTGTGSGPTPPVHSASVTVNVTSAPPPGNAPLWVLQVGTSLDDYGYGVAADSSGNVLMTGYSRGNFAGTNQGGLDAVVGKYDANGNPIWTRQLGSAGNDWGRAVAVDASGNVFVAGQTTGNLGAGTNSGLNDAFLAKYNASGTLLWTKLIGTPGDDIANAVAVDSTGNVIVGGSTTGSLGFTNQGGIDAWINKYDTNGVFVYSRQLGTAGDDVAYGIAVDGSGNAYLAGSTTGNMPGGSNAGLNDVFLAQYTSAGGRAWVSQWGTSGDDIASAAAVDPSGNIFLSGSSTGAFGGTNAGGLDAWVKKVGSNGVQIWTRQLGTAGDEDAFGVATDGAGNVYISGDTTGALAGASNGGPYDMYAAKYDTSGTQVWVRQLGGSLNEVSKAVCTAPGAAYIVGGTFGSLGGANLGGKDIVIARYAQ